MTYRAYFDGSCFLCYCGIGCVIRDAHGVPVWRAAEYAGRGDALKAEYLALTSLVERLALMNIENAFIHGDSRTVVGQVTGRINTREKNRFRDLIVSIRRWFAQHPGWTLRWIPRGENGHADALAVEGLSVVRTSIRVAPER